MYFLDQKDMPTRWYNILPDLPVPLPADLHPATGNPVAPEDLAPLFPMALIHAGIQPRTLYCYSQRSSGYFAYMEKDCLPRGLQLEKALATPAKIFYKYEGTCPAGSHKFNSAVPQAFLHKTEALSVSAPRQRRTWGSAISIAVVYLTWNAGLLEK
jgi:tryptophan synthase beta chain